MTDIKFACSNCRQPLEGPGDMAGQTIDCPSCGQPLVIPAPPPQTVHSEAAEHRPQPVIYQGTAGRTQSDPPRNSKTGGHASGTTKKRKPLLLFGIIILGIIAAAGLVLFFWPDPQSPVHVVERYLAVKRWEDRVPYVLHSEKVIEQMRERYTNFKGPKKFLEIMALTNNPLSTDGWTLVSVVYSRRPEIQGNEVIDNALFFVLKTDDGYKIDWEASTIANPMSLAEFKARRPRTPVTLRLAASLNSDSGSAWQRDEFWFFDMVIPHQDSITVLAEKGSNEGEQLFELVHDGKQRSVIVDVRYDDELDEYVVDRFVQLGWAYRDASEEQSEEHSGALGILGAVPESENPMPSESASQDDPMYNEGYEAGEKWSGTTKDGRKADWDDFVAAMKQMGTDMSPANEEDKEKWARYKKGFNQALADADQ